MAGFDMSALSNSDFERLMCDIWNQTYGLNLHTYPEGRDAGIDAKGIDRSGLTVHGQCKHYARTDRSKFIQAVEGERKKSGWKNADRYLFGTTFPLTPPVERQVADILEVPTEQIWGPDRINDVLRSESYAKIVRSNFKLWMSSTTVLERMMNSATWNRSEWLLKRISGEAKFWVDIPAFSEATSILSREGVCIITGGPGAGKTTLARRLLLDAQQDWEVVYVTNPRDAWDLVNPESKRIFFYEDFLGQAKLNHDAIDRAPDLEEFIARVRDDKSTMRLIMTTRDQVLQEAACQPSDTLLNLANDPARCLIGTNDLNNAARLEIIQTHLSFSQLGDEQRDRVRSDRLAVGLARHPSFNPRLVTAAIQGVTIEDSAHNALTKIENAFDKPDKLWRSSFEGLTKDGKRILLYLATLPPRPISLEEFQILALYRDKGEDWYDNLRALETSWLHIREISGGSLVDFSNPGCRDYLIGVLDRPGYARDWVARTTRMDQLLNLAHEAGIVATRSIDRVIDRPNLAQAIESNKTELWSRVRTWTEEEINRSNNSSSKMESLYSSAALLAALGNPRANGWILHISEQLLTEIQKLDAHKAMPLAARLAEVPFDNVDEEMAAEVVEDIILAGLRSVTSSRDLTTYENLPGQLKTPRVAARARDAAQRVLATEFNILLQNPRPRAEDLEIGYSLRNRAEYYGFGLDVDELKSRALDTED